MKRLSAIVGDLESDTINLDRSLELFAEGQSLIKICQTQLQEAEDKVVTLLSRAGDTVEQPGLHDKGDK
ncbi:exodeoxyribonuclease VII small subunit [Candidatus Neomarinimicrobiota bacterium]